MTNTMSGQFHALLAKAGDKDETIAKLQESTFTHLYMAKRVGDDVKLYCLPPNKGKEFEIPISESQAIFNHSDSFEFGFGGSGPSQLALAILYRVTRNKELALRLHKNYKDIAIAKLPRHLKEACMVGWDIVKWLSETGKTYEED